MPDGQGSFYVAGVVVASVGQVDTIFHYDVETDEFIQLDQRIPYSATAPFGIMVSGESLGI